MAAVSFHVKRNKVFRGDAGEGPETDAEMVQRANRMLRNWIEKQERTEPVRFTPFIKEIEINLPIKTDGLVEEILYMHVTYDILPLMEGDRQEISDDSPLGKELCKEY
ncbi:hypothetical protein HY967_04010 [Candidatus Jorgensenbacteria bacterium]|nr:hypothetical protein [Candidatus Jorgensenbacteria bacterium]